MASKPPGVSDSGSNPGFGHDRGLSGFGTLTRPGPTGPRTSLQDVERRLAELAHRFSSAIGWREKRSAAYELLGQHSFTAGVVWGMGENLTRTVVASVELVEVIALAEYWESRQNHTLMGQIRANAFFAIAPGASVDGVDYARRLDIADEATLQGVEYKTGYQTATQDNLWEIARDKALQDKAGWSIKWVFRDSASQPLQDALTQAGIDFSVGP